jgi:hypothetical protein
MGVAKKLLDLAVKAAREAKKMPAVMPAAERAANAQRFVAKSVVREGDKPLRVFSGTSKDVDFNSVRVPRNGAWFTTDPKVASSYATENDSMGFAPDPEAKRAWATKKVNDAPRVMPAYLNIENPMVYPDHGIMTSEVIRLGGDNYKRGQGLLFDQLRAQGYDGVKLGDDTYVTLRGPEQIKSASGNIGTYDPKQKRMDKARGGLAVKLIWDKKRPKGIGEPESLSVKRKAAAKRRAKAAGRPYPNLVDNMAAARKEGK